jgi:type VII secretion-associated serine protease mycosin
MTVFSAAPTRDEVRDAQWHLEYLHIAQAHQTSIGEGIIVGVVDTGVDAGHPDLAGALLPGTDTSPAGRSDAWEDLDGHGTTMAGLIAADGRSLGVAPGATVLPVRHSERGASIEVDSAEAIDWAVRNGATVLCLAFGGREQNAALRDAVARAIASDVLVVSAVGNSSGTGVRYPAGYPGVVGVGGVDREGNHLADSLIGSVTMLVAPASDITAPDSRTVISSGYSRTQGTSDATAIVAGVAALIRSEFPDLSAAEVIHRMTATAIDKGEPGRDNAYGYGIVDPVAALTADVPPLEPSTMPSATASSPGGSASGGESSGTPVGWLVGGGVGVLLIAGLVLALRRRTGS